MANIYKNLSLINDDADSWRKEYWRRKGQIQDGEASVDVVKKPRDKEGESADFFKAQHDMAKDILPKQTIAESGKMKMTPTEAFIEVYPNGKRTPQSMAQNPTTSGSYPSTGYSGKDGIPQRHIGTLQLDVKGNTAKWIGDHYLPEQTQGEQEVVVKPVLMTANIGTNIGNLIEEALKKLCQKDEGK